MNVAAKVVLIIFGVLVGHFITISLHPNGNWATKLWSLSHVCIALVNFFPAIRKNEKRI